jgi:ABC transport system ATP-binding/permease protein
MVLDEPTNDLDLETLEVLEEKLVEYSGTLLIVSHDREFLDHVVTSVLVFEGEAGRIQEYIGGYSDWQDWLARHRQAGTKASAESAAEKKSKSKPANTPRKLGFKEQRELNELPQRIEELESRQAELNQTINSADFYKQDHEHTNQTLQQLQQVDAQLSAAYQRWEELDALQG